MDCHAQHLHGCIATKSAHRPSELFTDHDSEDELLGWRAAGGGGASDV